MGAHDAVWASVRHAHEHTDEPAAQFCRRLGVPVSTYYRRRKREMWAARPALGEDASDRHDESLSIEAEDFTTLPTQTTDAKPTTRQRLIKRLYAAIDQELEQLEAGSFGNRRPSATEIERRTRTLTLMIRGLEKVLELDTDQQKPKRTAAGSRAPSGGSARVVANEDAAQMRRDIAQRLERLHTQWADTARPGDAQSGGD